MPADAKIPRTATQAMASANARELVGVGSTASQGRWRLQVPPLAQTVNLCQGYKANQGFAPKMYGGVM